MNILKVSQEVAQYLYADFCVPLTSHYFVGHPFEKISIGKLTLSVKKGNRRKLVNGKIVEIDYEVGPHGHPGYSVRRFLPNNVDKFHAVVD